MEPRGSPEVCALHSALFKAQSLGCTIFSYDLPLQLGRNLIYFTWLQCLWCWWLSVCFQKERGVPWWGTGCFTAGWRFPSGVCRGNDLVFPAGTWPTAHFVLLSQEWPQALRHRKWQEAHLSLAGHLVESFCARCCLKSEQATMWFCFPFSLLGFEASSPSQLVHLAIFLAIVTNYLSTSFQCFLW